MSLFIPGKENNPYKYYPSPSESTQLHKPSAWGRLKDYCNRKVVDQTVVKRFEVGIFGGPVYSQDNGLGLCAFGSAFYRLDRKDSITPPSSLVLTAEATLTGYFAVYLTGETIFRHQLHQLNYEVSFSSGNRSLWGIGYNEAIDNDNKTKYLKTAFKANIEYRFNVVGDIFLGALIDLNYSHASKFKRDGMPEPSEQIGRAHV